MGSDSVEKSVVARTSPSSWIRNYCSSRRKLASICIITPVVILGLLTLVPPPVPSFSSTAELLYSTSLIEKYPQQQCQHVASKFHDCQQHPRDGASLVLICHRQWCHSMMGGFCEPCGGIGSRMRCMMHMAQAAYERCIRVEVDAPPYMALVTVDDAVYRDRMGVLAELFHFRSYGDLSSQSRTQWKCNTRDWEGKRTYLHGTPDCYLADNANYNPLHGGRIGKFDFDPCLFHTVFRPSIALQAQVELHLRKTGHEKRVIGIHLRTGDALAYGMDNRDARIPKKDLNHVLDNMIQCAQEHARNLLLSTTKDGEDMSNVMYFLATDSQEVKALAAARYGQTVYTTDIALQSWLRADADIDAWLEILLLSRTQGIVANVRMGDYHGNSDVISTFPRLAAKIGFMTDEQFFPCEIE